MATITKYRIWCVDDDRWIETWSETEPTGCPENVAHAIDTTKTSIIDTVSETIPLSEIGGKVWVHQSAKPVLTNKTLYSMWSGAGDDLADNTNLGTGPLMKIQCSPGTALSIVDMKFNPIHGDIYIHQGYISWEGAGFGDYVSADVIAQATAVQTVANLDLIIDGNGYIKYSPTGPGTGTHGFAATPKLLPRSFSHDGHWNYTPITGLSPNFTGTGDWNISTNEEVVHRFINRIPVCGTSNGYMTLDSTESFKLPQGYFLRIKATNVSDTSWKFGTLILLFRERTFKP